jgi:hypothetical protein
MKLRLFHKLLLGAGLGFVFGAITAPIWFPIRANIVFGISAGLFGLVGICTILIIEIIASIGRSLRGKRQ